MTRTDAVARESPYQRAAAEWVARYNRSPESGVSQIRHDNGEPNRMTLTENITDVTFKVVGAYYYSEHTNDPGGFGISYTLWDTERKPIKDMEIDWHDGMNAGKFIEECVAILKETKEEEETL